MQYVNREIKDPLILTKLRDDADFMLEVFKLRKVASEFDRVSDRLKEDKEFIQKTKEIFWDNSLEFFSLSISLRNYKKEKEQRDAQQIADTQRRIEGKKKKRGENSAKAEKNVSINVQVSVPGRDVMPTFINFETKVPLRVEEIRKPSMLVDKTNNKENEENSFDALIEQVPISQEERDLVIAMYQDASDEKKLVAWKMVYDFVTYNGKKHPIRLLKSPSNNVYRFTERF